MFNHDTNTTRRRLLKGALAGLGQAASGIDADYDDDPRADPPTIGPDECD